MKVRAIWAAIGSLVTLGVLRALVQSISRDMRRAARKNVGSSLCAPPPSPEGSRWGRFKTALTWEGTALVESPRRLP